jgi:CRP-like cAMP-binding protein
MTAPCLPETQTFIIHSVGTSRSYVTRLMNRFRRLGLIDYQGYFHGHPHPTVRTGPLTARMQDDL